MMPESEADLRHSGRGREFFHIRSQRLELLDVTMRARIQPLDHDAYSALIDPRPSFLDRLPKIISLIVFK